MSSGEPTYLDRGGDTKQEEPNGIKSDRDHQAQVLSTPTGGKAIVSQSTTSTNDVDDTGKDPNIIKKNDNTSNRKPSELCRPDETLAFNTSKTMNDDNTMIIVGGYESIAQLVPVTCHLTDGRTFHHLSQSSQSPPTKRGSNSKQQQDESVTSSLNIEAEIRRYHGYFDGGLYVPDYPFFVKQQQQRRQKVKPKR
jgi:hypothetical protein